MKRPILIILIYYLTGILMGRYLHNGIALFVISLGIAVVLYKKKRDRAFIAAPIFMLVGMLLTVSVLKDDKLYSGEIKAEGVITSITYSQSGRQRLDIKTKDGIKIRVMTSADYDVDIGDIIAVKGEAVMPDKPTNPGEFDDYIYSKREGISFRLYEDAIYRTGKKNMPIASLIFDARRLLNESIDRLYTSDNAPLIKAVVTGDKSSISEDLRLMYTEGGAIHVLCVSGLHVGIIAAALIFIIKRLLGIKGALSAALVSLLLLVYMVFIGMSASVIRAVIMAIIAILAEPLGRKSDGLNNIYLAALVILVFEPLMVFSTGFLLSFACVFGIVLTTEYIKIEGKGKYIKNLLLASFSATVFSLPITAYYFYNVSFAGIITNLIILPLTPFVVVFGIISAGLGVISVGLGTFFAGTAAAVLWLYKAVLMLVSAIPFLNFTVGRPSVILCAAFYAALILIITNKFNRKSYKLAAGICTAAMFVMLVSNKAFFKNTEIAFLDVGQGDSAVITDYNGNVFVVDTGGKMMNEDENTGVRYVYPYLKYKGIDAIDVLFISHPDMDHALGSIGLMDVCSIEKIVFADFDYEESELYDKIIEKAAEKGTEVAFMTAGDSIICGEMMFDCIYPYDGAGGSDNDGSLVVKFTYNDFSALFMGDLGIEKEKLMVDNGVDVSADVLKVSHHGSKYSTSEEFAEAVGCECAVISAGENNTYGHPHKEVMDIFDDADCFVTAKNGAVIVRTNGKDYSVKTMK